MNSFKQFLTEKEQVINSVNINIDTSNLNIGIDSDLVTILKEIISDIQDFGIRSLKDGKEYTDTNNNKIAKINIK